MTSPHPAPKSRPPSAKTLTERLKGERAAARAPGADLVPDASGGDPIPYEVRED